MTAPARAFVRGVSALLAVWLVLASGAGPAASDEPRVDLEGSWFVLVHYRDWMTANPDADRWEDKVWTFERKGSRLEWTEYPIVVFDDDSGRFGRVGMNTRARLLEKWEPNEGQLAEIAAGPKVNNRGSKSKSLRGSPERGWASSSSARTASAFTVGYQEHWSIDDPTKLPVFTRDDALGTEASLATGGDEAISGRTRYVTLQVLDGGDVLQGRYARDENRKGSFRMLRAGAVRGVGGREGARKRLRAGVQARAGEQMAYAGFVNALGNDCARRLRETVGEEQLTAVWERYEKRILGQDARAPGELAEALQQAYWSAVEDDFRGLSDAELQALLDGRVTAAGDPERAALLRDVQQTLGDDSLSSRRARFEAGDARAREALRAELGQAYADAFGRRIRERLAPGSSDDAR